MTLANKINALLALIDNGLVYGWWETEHVMNLARKANGLPLAYGASVTAPALDRDADFACGTQGDLAFNAYMVLAMLADNND